MTLLKILDDCQGITGVQDSRLLRDVVNNPHRRPRKAGFTKNHLTWRKSCEKKVAP